MPGGHSILTRSPKCTTKPLSGTGIANSAKTTSPALRGLGGVFSATYKASANINRD
jgi:hypothetical protein